VKRITVEQLASVFAHLPPNPRVVASGNFATPRTLLGVLDEQVPEYTLHMLNAQPGIPDREGVILETCFVGPAMRHSPRLRYIPSRLSLVPVLYRGPLRPDAVIVHASAPRYDTVSLGIEVNVMPAAIEAAREVGAPVIVQANPQMPYTYGDGQVYDSEIDYLVEVDEPVAEAALHEPSDVSQAIGDRIAAQVPDGSTLQLGIGDVPDAVLHRLVDRRGLRIWSEMFSDGALALEHSGALDPQIPLTASFLFGSRDLYDFVHLNHRVRMLRTETTNDPGRIARQRQMTSVNSALQVDLFDQANASRMKGRIYSGFGGSVDFIDGALHSRGGASYIALPSWHPKADVSTIVPRLEEPVTSFQHSFVVTEQGVAPVVGLSEREQARSLIEHAAHPDARPVLWEAAAAQGLA
jgi:acyl-CoA hydrolase